MIYDEERCALCEQREVDDRWLWFTVSRNDENDTCEFVEIELAFCSQEHAAEFLAGRELDWPEHDHAERTAGTRVDTYFLGCGLLAIVLSAIGVVALVRWVF